VVYFIYPLAVLVFYAKAYRKQPVTFQVPPVKIAKGVATITDEDIGQLRNNCFLKDTDSHAALVHGWLWGVEPKYAGEGLTKLVAEDGSILRRYPNNDPLPASGDCLVSWCWAYEASGYRNADLLKKVVDHFIKHTFSLRNSTRSACGGVNYSTDGAFRLTQPCFGPQYYTASCLLALAARDLGGKYKALYWAYYVVFGGWLWWVTPVLHSKKDTLYYVQDITMRALWVICRVRGTTFGRAFAMRRIFSLTHQMNPFFYAHMVNVGATWGREKECEDRLLALSPCFGFMPQRNPDDRGYFDTSRIPRHQSIVAFALRLLWK
jgi:hypothetical protein